MEEFLEYGNEYSYTVTALQIDNEGIYFRWKT